jgi:Fur family ferric uptake transcriptional regulator
MTDLIERLRDRGWRMTAQRRAVAQALAGANVHLTADEVLERARDVVPETSRATVYNTLNELVEMGELGEVAPDGRSKRYDPNVVDVHHHLLCVECGSLRDVHELAIDPVEAVADVTDFEISGVQIVFSGTCSECRASRS